MKPGDVVALRPDRVVVQLMSDSLENSLEVKKDVLLIITEDIGSFRRGDSGLVLELNKKNIARVKILYKSCAWWINVSDLMVVG